MTALDLLAKLQGDGFNIRADGESLIVSPASRLSGEDRERVRIHKPALLLILTGKGPASGAKLYYQPDPSRERSRGKGIPPRYWTWEGAPQWFPVDRTEEAEDDG